MCVCVLRDMHKWRLVTFLRVCVRGGVRGGEVKNSKAKAFYLLQVDVCLTLCFFCVFVCMCVPGVEVGV